MSFELGVCSSSFRFDTLPLEKIKRIKNLVCEKDEDTNENSRIVHTL